MGPVFANVDEMAARIKARKVPAAVLPLDGPPVVGGPSVAFPVASVAQWTAGAVVTPSEQPKAVPCVPCAKKRAAVCDNCGGTHETAKCPIPAEYDGNYQNDSGGNPGCNCA